jgi:hypothetical protein
LISLTHRPHPRATEIGIVTSSRRTLQLLPALFGDLLPCSGTPSLVTSFRKLLGALLDIRPRSVQSDHGARFEVEGLGDPGADCCCVHRRTWCCGCTWQGEDQSACLIMSPQIPRRMHPRDMCAAIAPGHWALSPLCTACMATAWARLASRNMGAVMHSLSY